MSSKMMYGVSLKGYRSSLGDTLLELGEKNENIVVIDAETGTVTNVMGFREKFPDRYITVGIAEQTAVSFAFALARSGKIPIVPLFSSFMTRRACDQIFLQVGYANANVKMIGCYSGLTTPNTGATHQSINDVAIIRSMPNIRVIETADPVELSQAVEEMVRYEGPVYLRMVRGDISRYDVQCVPEDNKFAIEKSSLLREGNDISLIASGIMVARALEAADILDKEGVSAEVVNCTSIKPLDQKTIIRSAQKTGRVVTCENSSIIGCMGSAVAECLAQYHPVPMRFVGIEDQYGWSGDLEELFEMYGLTTEKIIEKSRELL